MKKLGILAPAFLLFSFITADNTISKKERTDAITLLKQTEKGVFASVKGLSKVQLKFKPAPDRWSVEECLKHIAVTEKMLWTVVDATLKQPANPQKKSEIKTTDEQLVKNLEDRSTKIKTIDPLKPENTPYKSAADALDSFRMSRQVLIKYVDHTSDDLRDHIASLPIGTYDSYQLILLMGGHSNRHTHQIEEVKADPNFPKN